MPVIGDKANVEGEEDEKFLVLKISVNCLGNKQRVHEENLILTVSYCHRSSYLLSNTIVHPGTMVVHLFDTSKQITMFKNF